MDNHIVKSIVEVIGVAVVGITTLIFLYVALFRFFFPTEKEEFICPNCGSKLEDCEFSLHCTNCNYSVYG